MSTRGLWMRARRHDQALLHPVGKPLDKRVTPGSKVKQFKKLRDAPLSVFWRHMVESADKPQKFLSRELSVKIGTVHYFSSLTIVLVIFIPVGQAVVAERYTYIPYIGLFVILGRVYVYLEQRKHSFSPKLRYGHTAVIGIMLIVFAHGAYARNTVWRDTLDLIFRCD